MKFVLEVAVRKCSFLNHSQGILGVRKGLKVVQISYLYYVIAILCHPCIQELVFAVILFEINLMESLKLLLP
jgi:hypothetical protein